MADDSKLLIEEDIMGNPPYWTTAMLDMFMMVFGGKKRTIECWTDVTSKAGLQISHVHQGNGPWKNLSVIECVKAPK
jgi:hypothetical protein